MLTRVGRRTPPRLDRRATQPQRIPARSASDQQPGHVLGHLHRLHRVRPRVDGDLVWTTHVAGHPPTATLVFWLLDRVGLGGGFWAGTPCTLASSAVSVAVAVTLRELGAPAAARRVVPFAALFPVRSGWRLRPTAYSPAWPPPDSHWSAWAPSAAGSCQASAATPPRRGGILVLRSGALRHHRAGCHDHHPPTGWSAPQCRALAGRHRRGDHGRRGPSGVRVQLAERAGGPADPLLPRGSPATGPSPTSSTRTSRPG